MSIDQLTSGAQSLANTVSSGQNVTNRLASDLGAGGAGDAGSWLSKLRPASFRGVPFKVLEGQLKFGRRSVIHDIHSAIRCGWKTWAALRDVLLSPGTSSATT
jgi:hypothetical protein